jgi:hypothetical protein
MRRAEVHLKGWRIVRVMAELGIWLDRNDCTAHSFEIIKAANGELVVRVEFSEDALGDAFEREFGR